MDNSYIITLIIYDNLRAIYGNLCFYKIHHRGAFLNMNDHKLAEGGSHIEGKAIAHETCSPPAGAKGNFHEY